MKSKHYLHTALKAVALSGLMIGAASALRAQQTTPSEAVIFYGGKQPPTAYLSLIEGNAFNESMRVGAATGTPFTVLTPEGEETTAWKIIMTIRNNTTSGMMELMVTSDKS
jgi:hypothetical protein